MATWVETHSYFRNTFFLFTFLFLAFGLLITAPQISYCQNTGFKYIKNYDREDYMRQPQNWWILQDKRGIIYVANQGGLLEFDGVSWRLISIPNLTVRSIAMDDKGTIYIGGNNEIGFLAPDSDGSLQYKTLVDRLKEKDKKFSNVWVTHSTKEGVYFSSYKFLFRWNPSTKQLKTWMPQDRFLISFTCERKFFIDQQNVGLMQMDNDSLELIHGGETFADKTIVMMAPHQTMGLLIGTSSGEFYTYNGKTTTPFSIEAADYLKGKRFFRGIRLKSDDFALATLKGGLVIIDPSGRIKHIFNETSGLQDNDVKYVFEDRQGNLWLALNNGISKIEYSSPISIHDKRTNLSGLVLSVTRHGPGSVLYAGTTSGLYSLAPPNTPGGPGKFQPVPGINSRCRFLLSTGDSLLAATSKGVFQVKNNLNKNKVIPDNSHILIQSNKEKNRIWVGTEGGLSSICMELGTWVKEHEFKDVTQPIYTIIEDQKGSLWLGTLTGIVLKVDFSSSGTITNPDVKPFDSAHGLPEGEINVFMAAEHVMFATQRGIFCFDKGNKLFIPDQIFGVEFAGGPKGKGVYRIMEDKNKNIWIHSKRRNIQAIPQANGTFVLKRKPFLRFAGYQANVIYPDPEGNAVWFACNEGLIRYDERIKKKYDLDFKILIRQVLVNGKPFLHDVENKIDNGSNSKVPFPVLEYKENNLSFKFAAPFFEGESATEYQSILEGYEKDWSEWSLETQKDYTNLVSGTYTFRVHAKNTYEHLSNEAVLRFKILLPWYITWWAFLLYLLIFSMLTFLVVKWWRSGKLEREKLKLERIVKERTKEIEEKNQQLENQTQQLKEQSEKLKEMDKVKSRFFANISHEFRTPLTLIMGPLEQMLSGQRDQEEKKRLNMMLRNSQRLLGLINQLLELSKFDSGKMKLQAVGQNIVPFLKGIVDTFDSVADENELDLTFHTEEKNINLYFDPGKLEEIIFNLLSNAVKFTPPGGKITVAVEEVHTGEDKFHSGSVHISVRDTGPGIPRDQLAHIFDRFYQSDRTYEHHQKGSGIGLAIAKELVELHRGSIDVHSSEGIGSEFIIRLPMGKEHLNPDEIVEISSAPTPRKTPSEIPALYVTEKAVRVPKDAEDETDSGGKPETTDVDKRLKDEEDTDLLAPKNNIILVVEDSADVRDYIRGSLEPLYEVVEAVNGREGIQKAQEIIPDLIISDIMMPEVDGCELCRVLKNDVKTSHIPIILLTARASEESIIYGLEKGADDYITKPFNTRILRARIKNLIELRSHMQQTLNRELTLKPVEILVSQIDKKFIKKLQEVINENISDPEFNIDQLCKKMDMSQPSIYRKIHALCGESPTEFIRSYRLKRGAELLKSNFGSVLEVAFEVGFSSANYFTKCFKRKFHQLPSTFLAAESET